MPLCVDPLTGSWSDHPEAYAFASQSAGMYSVLNMELLGIGGRALRYSQDRNLDRAVFPPEDDFWSWMDENYNPFNEDAFRSIQKIGVHVHF